MTSSPGPLILSQRDPRELPPIRLRPRQPSVVDDSRFESAEATDPQRGDAFIPATLAPLEPLQLPQHLDAGVEANLLSLPPEEELVLPPAADSEELTRIKITPNGDDYFEEYFVSPCRRIWSRPSAGS